MPRVDVETSPITTTPRVSSQESVDVDLRALDILIIEDDGDSRRALELMLGHLGHLVMSAGSLREAGVLLEAFVIDLVITDLRLPDGDGAELISRWPLHAPRVPSIVLSGCNDEATVKRCLAAGFDAFLHKPLDCARLQRLVCRVMGRPL